MREGKKTEGGGGAFKAPDRIGLNKDTRSATIMERLVADPFLALKFT